MKAYGVSKTLTALIAVICIYIGLLYFLNTSSTINHNSILSELIKNKRIINEDSIICNNVENNELQGFQCKPLKFNPISNLPMIDAGDCILKNSQMQCFPYFMIIGVMKGGTGTLMRVISEAHSHIKPGRGLSGEKEVHFFTREINLIGLNNDKSLTFEQYDQYIRRFPSMRYSNSKSPKTFDKSPDYIRNKTSLQLIHRMLPSVKLIIILRDPVSRAMSAFDHNCRHGRYIKLSSYGLDINSTHTIPAHSVLFKAQWSSLLNLRGIEYHTLTYPCNSDDFTAYYLSENNLSFNPWNMAEIKHGFYDDQIKDVLGIFNPNQILIIFSDDMRRSISEVIVKVNEFIGLGNDTDYRSKNSKVYSKLVESLFYKERGSVKIREGVGREVVERLKALYSSHVDLLRLLLRHSFGLNVPNAWNDI